jgi:predicted nucleic acid-binding protein
MTPLFLDTSFVIALLNASDRHHEEAKAWHATLLKEQRPRLTTTAILLELGDGFARKGRWDLISPFLAAVVNDPMVQVVSVDGSLLQQAREFRDARQDKDWGLTDCVSFVVMGDHGLNEALTADRHFQQAGFRALLLEP